MAHEGNKVVGGTTEAVSTLGRSSSGRGRGSIVTEVAI